MHEKGALLAALDQRIEADRIIHRLEQLFMLGPPPHANRPGLSRDEQAACELASTWMAEAGLEVSTDRFGNLFGRYGSDESLSGRDRAGPPASPGPGEIWTGSHLDTVPAGGRFDGALGVVAGIEAVAAMAQVIPPARTTAVVSFRDEEGWRFGTGTFGSRGICGGLTPGELEDRDGDGVSVRAALLELGLDPATELAPSPPPGAFIELHVEQGPVLASSGYAVGLVSGIVGMIGGELVFTGRAGHAGTTPMDQRSDAVLAGARAVAQLADAARMIPGAVATIGSVDTKPGASNVIPSRVVMSLDLRAPDDDRLDALLASLETAAAAAAAETGCSWELRGMWRRDAVTMSAEIRRAIRQCADALGEPLREISSGALHDAGVLAAAGVPTGMIFVRSNAGGVSHTPEEDSDHSAILAATRVLARTLLVLATDIG